ncbi:hypothetical protein BD410DRAFT_743712 [Rickenella mellea]|uniref:Large ribosomal subunit protein uL30m n=1 Tax=Rickenella mellea TaxID=50990 RepID=A0A4Y7QDY8_9AGAM|nr:hypothetical protein BD410DRAFT_743712 [Rickenella mellea]
MNFASSLSRRWAMSRPSHCRSISNASPRLSATPAISEDRSNVPASPSPNSHFKITLLRSPISLGARIKGTLVSLGIHRRMQTVYFPHSPEVAGKILAVKELVAVENVPSEAVRTKTQQRHERKASRGFVVIGGLKDRLAELSPPPQRSRGSAS